MNITSNIASDIIGYKDLSYTFVVKNGSTQSIYVDTELVEKMLQIPSSNFEFIVEKKISGKFRLYDNRAGVDAAPVFDSIESKSIKKIQPDESHKFNYLLQEIYQLTRGQYRIKVKLDFKDDKKNVYVASSKWNYFFVRKVMPVHHWYQD
ncbi:MAG: hypothetical protein QM726_14455 [Chitinophagaceae bacterium]